MAEQQEWETHFRVEERRRNRDTRFGEVSEPHWVIVNILSGDEIGEYRDHSYARKQARRKYKKLVRFMEKTFMSRDQ